MDQISTFRVELESGGVHAEVVLEDAYVGIDAGNLGGNNLELVVGLLEQGITIEHLYFICLLALKHSRLVQSTEPNRLLFLILLKNLLYQWIIPLSYRLGPISR